MFDQVWTSTQKTIKRQFNKWVWNAIRRVRLYTNYVLDFKNVQSCSFFFAFLRNSWKGKFSSSHFLGWAAVQVLPSPCLFSNCSLFLKCPFSPTHLAKTYLSLKAWLKQHLHFTALITQDPRWRNQSLFFLCWCNTFLVSLL